MDLIQALAYTNFNFYIPNLYSPPAEPISRLRSSHIKDAKGDSCETIYLTINSYSCF